MRRSFFRLSTIRAPFVLQVNYHQSALTQPHHMVLRLYKVYNFDVEDELCSFEVNGFINPIFPRLEDYLATWISDLT